MLKSSNVEGETPNVGYEILCSLLSGNHNLESIDLYSDIIQTNGREDLSDFLASNPRLKQLKSNNNHFNVDDTVLIADALRSNTNSERLTLDDNGIVKHPIFLSDILRRAIYPIRHCNDKVTQIPEHYKTLNGVSNSNHT